MIDRSSQILEAHDSASRDPERWLSAIAKGRTEDEIEVIRRACDLASRAHGGRLRLSGETYMQHVLNVAGILAQMRMDHEAIAAAILHEITESDAPAADDLQAAFGPAVAHMVTGVRKITGIADRRQDLDGQDLNNHAEGLRKLLLALVDDWRVVLIKLADCLDNVRHLREFPDARARELVLETRDIYAPLANRLGVWQIKWELEDRVLRHLEPEAYRRLARLLDERRADRQGYIDQVIRQLRGELKRAGIAAEISGRPKHIYSIWRKMQHKGLDFHQLFDIRAVRVLVEDVPACYAALGVVHSLWHHIPGEFDDYIATPKGNLYQSLHTAVVGPDGKTLEVQIRSHEMHQHAELGVAAHWRYKEGSRYDAAIERRIGWLRQLAESKETFADAGELVQQFQADTAHERVYVFTPKGKVIDLPLGATPLDFAYSIHTDVGHRCRGAKIDGQIVPLSHPLVSGETVEVLLAREPAPSRNWLSSHLGYLKTSRARAKVRHWFNQQDHEKNQSAGRGMLERELGRLGVASYDQKGLLRRFHSSRIEDFLAALGRGEVSAAQLAASLGEQLVPPPEPTLETLKRTGPRHERAADAVQIDGVGNLLVHMARCCKPVPYDSIIGYITRGRGVTIHRSDCDTILHYADEDRERLIEVQWSERADAHYSVDILVQAYDRQGLLRDVTSVLAQERVNVTGAQTASSRKLNTASLLLTLEITDLTQLSRVLEKIGQLANVIDVRRKT